jgi:hypothetical protein
MQTRGGNKELFINQLDEFVEDIVIKESLKTRNSIELVGGTLGKKIDDQGMTLEKKIDDLITQFQNFPQVLESKIDKLSNN